MTTWTGLPTIVFCRTAPIAVPFDSKEGFENAFLVTGNTLQDLIETLFNCSATLKAWFALKLPYVGQKEFRDERRAPPVVARTTNAESEATRDLAVHVDVRAGTAHQEDDSTNQGPGQSLPSIHEMLRRPNKRYHKVEKRI
jgi:hypothetical protein